MVNAVSYFSVKTVGRAIGVFSIFIACVLELFLVNRKFGIFTGGFGSSIVVDSVIERLWFIFLYLLSQLLLAFFVFSLTRWLTRRLPEWVTAVVFSVIFIQFVVLVLMIKFQLHSYFSDALTFTLIKNLGGGSLVDALLYASNEAVQPLFLVVILVVANWFAWRWLKKRTVTIQHQEQRSPLLRFFSIVIVLFVIGAYTVPRAASDTQRGLNRTIAFSTFSGLLNKISDFDTDGYGLFHHLYDGAPFDGKSYPYAVELTENNRIKVGGFDLELDFEPKTVEPKVAQFLPASPHVVIVVMESARSDLIGKRIGGKPVAPNLETLIKNGSVQIPSFSHVGFTTHSLKSLFSGELLPTVKSPSLFDDFKNNGYKIGVFSGQPESFGDISATVRMKQNADIYYDAEILKEKRAFSFAAKGSLLVAEQHLLEMFSQNFSEKRQWQQPVFLYFNFQSGHFPYYHRDVPLALLAKPIARDDISLKNKEHVAATYWNALAYSDQQLGVLIAKLKDIGVWDNTLLFVTSDHGEELYDDGFLGHGHVINFYQNATFLASSKAAILPAAPISISDFRNIVLDVLSGQQVSAPTKTPFMYVGDLAKPNQIGLASSEQGHILLTTLKFDTGEVCFVEKQKCLLFKELNSEGIRRAKALLQRWATEVLQQRKLHLTRVI